MEENTPIVWVAQRPTLKGRKPVDLSAAEKFGQIEFVFDEGHTELLLRESLTDVYAIALDVFHADFNPATDYILPLNLGSPLANFAMSAAAMQVASDRQFQGDLRVLSWNRNIVSGGRDRTQGFYDAKTLTLEL